MGFELDGFISANNPQSAFDKAINLAQQEFPEIKQAENIENKPPPVPVINAEEIDEFSDAPQGEIDKIEINWHEEQNV